MKTIGNHLLLELTGCPAEKLADMEYVKHQIHAAAHEAKATILNGYFHQFSPTGVSGLLCLAESHISIHTWPESGYAAVDIYTCGPTAKPIDAMNFLVKALGAQQHHLTEMTRGVHDDGGKYVSVPVQRASASERHVHEDSSALGNGPVLAHDHAKRSGMARKRFKPQPVE